MDDSDEFFPPPNATIDFINKLTQKLNARYLEASVSFSSGEYSSIKLILNLIWFLRHIPEKLESNPELQEAFEHNRQQLMKKASSLYKEFIFKFIHTPSPNKTTAFNDLNHPNYKSLSFFNSLLWQSGDPLYNYVYFADMKLKDSLNMIWINSNKWKFKTIFLYGPYRCGKSFLIRGVCELKGAMLLEIANVDIVKSHPKFFEKLYFLCGVIFPLVIHFKNIENISAIMKDACAFCKQLAASVYDKAKLPLVFFTSSKHVPAKLPPQFKEVIYCYKEMNYANDKAELVTFYAMRRMMYIDFSKKQRKLFNETYTDFTNKPFEEAVEKLDAKKNVGVHGKSVEFYTYEELTNILNDMEEM